MNKCEMCKKFEGSVPLTYSVEYGIWLCNDCLNSVVEVNKNLFGKVLTENLFKHHKSVYVPYNKIKEDEEMKVKVRRNESKEIEIDVNDLQVHDTFDISRGGEVIATGTVFDAWTGVDGTQRIDAIISFKKESKTWEDLGYDCFEDMIDDIAKEHGSLRRYEKTMRCVDPSNYIKIHDAAHEGKKYVLADTFGKSIIRVINDDGSSTIYDADQFQVYLEEDDNDKSIDEED